jgi:hypothetical protein
VWGWGGLGPETVGRILARPFEADAFFKEILADSVQGRGSVVQRIWNSDVFGHWLRLKVQESGETANNAASLRAAKHRFESMAKPLGRMLLHISPFLDVVQDIITKRSDDAAADCVQWVESLSEEKLVQLGMLADASDEMLVLTRSLDSEEVDTAGLHEVLESFLANMDGLLNRGKCLEVTSYTKHVLDALARTRIFHLPDATVRSVGGMNDKAHVVQKCLSRMVAWLHIAREVLVTEFPDYEVFQAFRVFNLGTVEPGKEAWNLGKGTKVEECLNRLAVACTVDPAHLYAEFAMHHPIAFTRKTQSVGLDNKAAWKDAVESTQKHHGTKKSYSVEALRPVLARYLGWTCATSAVEQGFSVGLRALGFQRGSMKEGAEETAMRFACYKPDPREVDEVITRARSLWEECFGTPRSSGCRVDAGVPRHKTIDGTEAAWLRQRRAAANAVGREGASEQGLVGKTPLPIELTERQEKELERQRKQQNKRRMEAYTDGLLLQDEITPDLEEGARILAKRTKAADAGLRILWQKRQATVTARRQLVLQPRSRVWVDEDVKERDLVLEKLRRHQVCISNNDEVGASNAVFVVSDPASPNNCIHWAAGLTGACVVPADTVLSATMIGAFLQYHALVQRGTRRTLLWMSNKFQEKHPKLSRIVQAACAAEGSQWTATVCAREELDDARRVHRNCRNVALTRESENIADLGRPWTVCTKASFAKQFQVDVALSSAR